jgi:hypothetical protein
MQYGGPPRNPRTSRRHTFATSGPLCLTAGAWGAKIISATIPPRQGRSGYSGMFPCLRGGLLSRLLRSISKALITRARVSRGSITSST